MPWGHTATSTLRAAPSLYRPAQDTGEEQEGVLAESDGKTEVHFATIYFIRWSVEDRGNILEYFQKLF